MGRSSAWGLRALTLGMSASLVLAACGGPAATGGPNTSAAPQGSGGTGSSEAPAGGATKGGTLYLLQPSSSTEWNQIDPQRAYTGEDLAFFGATIYRSLVAYKYSPDPLEGLTLVPDMATDTGQANAEFTEWKFTLRDGLTWEDGSEVTCEDVKYGVSRVFASDVITEGPTYAIQYLDIPGPSAAEEEAGWLSAYHGPYDKGGQDLYDKAVLCDDKTITFKLNAPHPDFNFTTTLGFSAVPAPGSALGDRDTGETYGQPDNPAVSNGPYKVESYSTGNGGKFILVRNENWKQESDDYRGAYPDRWEVHFGIDDKVLDQRLIASAGDDAFAMQYGQVQPENLATIFQDADTALPDYENRAVSGFDPYSRYYWINVQKVKNVKIRQAMMVALDRAAVLANIGGDFAGTFADGAIKPNIGQDYAETGLWSTFFGQPVPDTGDAELAKKLINESGETAPDLTFDFSDSPTNQQTAAIVIESLGRAGFKVTGNPIASNYYSTVYNNGHEFGMGGWGADWPNAATVIAPMYTDKGGWNLSHVEDKDFEARIDANLAETDRAKQAAEWQALNKEAAENAWIIPTFFGRSQTIAGSSVGVEGSDKLYRWPAYGSNPYSKMYAKQS